MRCKLPLTTLVAVLCLALTSLARAQHEAMRSALGRFIRCSHLTDDEETGSALRELDAPSFLEQLPLPVHLRIHHSMGALNLLEVLTISATEATALVAKPDGERFEVQLAIASVDDPRLTMMGLQEARRVRAERVTTRGTFAFPDTPVGRALHDWYLAFQAHDRATLEAFLRMRFDPAYLNARGIEFYLDMVERLSFMGGLLAPAAIARASEFELTVVADDGHDGLEITLHVDAARPMRITGLGVMPRGHGAQPDLQRAENTEQLVAQLDEHIGALASRGDFSGCVLVARDDELLFERAWGPANRERGIANTTGTRFNLASMTKMLTATCVVGLAEAGELQLSSTVGELLPEQADSRLAAIRVDQLLTHSSGWGAGAMVALKARRPREQLLTVDDWFQELRSVVPTAAPGTAFEYSNAGYVLLGKIVETLAGKPFGACIQERVLRPAGMRDSAFLAVDALDSRVAMGYSRALGEGDVWTPNTDDLFAASSPAGGSFSTARDLWSFARALLGGGLVGLDSLTEMTRARTYPAGPASYGAGFSVQAAPDGRGWFGHTGGFTGVSTSMRIYADRGYVVVVLANMNGVATLVTRWIDQLLP